MPTKIVIKKNTWFDSVSLMSVSTKANKLPGVEQAVVAMGAGEAVAHVSLLAYLRDGQVFQAEEFPGQVNHWPGVSVFVNNG